jgi:membrane associated rhomboid family serine protease
MTQLSKSVIEAPRTVPAVGTSLLSQVARLAGRMPFAVTLGFVVLAATIGAHSLPGGGVRQTRILFGAGYLALVQERHWWSPLTSVLFSGSVGSLVSALVVIAVVGGFAEHRMGTLRTIVAYLASSFVSVFAGVGLEILLTPGNPFWADHVRAFGSLDPVRPMVGVVMAASAFCGTLWRRRIRVVVFCIALVLVLYSGHPGNIYWFVSAVCGLAVGWLFHSPARRGRWTRSSHHEIRVLVSSVVAVTAAGPLVAILSPTRFGVLAPIAMLTNGDLVPDCDQPTFTRVCLQDFALDPVRHHTIVLGSLIPVAILLIAAYYLLRGRRGALWFAVAFNGILGLSSLVSFILLPIVRDATRRVPSQPHSWPGHFALAASAITPLAAAMLLLVLRRHFAVGPVFPRIQRLLRAIPGIDHQTPPGSRIGVAAPGSAALTRQLLAGDGESLSHIATWGGNSYWFTNSADAGLAYRVVGGVAVTSGGPFGRPAAYEEAVRGFARFCDDNGWHPVIYSADDRVLRPIARAMGWRTTTVAEEAVLDPTTWSTTGRKWQDVRTAVNKAKKAEITAVWTRFASLGLVEQTQIAEISEQWVAGKNLPEMSFTLGGLGEMADPAVHLMLAMDPTGRIEAVTSWMPFSRSGTVAGWTLDVMRRRYDAMNGVMEFLIHETMKRARAEGLTEVSLSGAPLARPHAAGPATPLDRTLERIGSVLESHYGFASLMRFKDKFQPSYRPLVMAYPDPALLGTIGIALMRAYLPTLSVRQVMRLLRS